MCEGEVDQEMAEQTVLKVIMLERHSGRMEKRFTNPIPVYNTLLNNSKMPRF